MNNAPQKQPRFTAETYIDWAMAQPTGRFELSNGEVVAMAPERVTHARAKLEALIALRTAIKTAGLGCEAITDGIAVRVDDHTVYEPDALVRCGPKAPGDIVMIDDPVIVVEVISPSSRGIDTGVKLAGYFQLPSLRHYLVVDTETRVVIHHHRDGEGAIWAQIRREGALSLDPPGLTVEIGDIFATL